MLRNESIQTSVLKTGKGDKIADLLVIVGAPNARKIGRMIHRSEIREKRKKVLTIVVPIFCVLVTIIVYSRVHKANLYSTGISLQTEGKWEEAISTFEQIRNYSDSNIQIDTTYYLQAKNHMKNHDWESAIASFELANHFSDSDSQIDSLHYTIGTEAMEEANWVRAIEYFEKARGYSNSNLKIEECYYRMGLVHLANREWDNAVDCFIQADTYSNSSDMICRVRYEEGLYLLQNQEWDKAESAFVLAGDYLDSKDQIKNVQYSHAKQLVSEGKYFEAHSIYSAISGYLDVQTLLETNSHFSKITSLRKTIVEGYVFSYGSYTGKSIKWKVLSVGESSVYCIATDKVTSLAFNSKVTVTGKSNSYKSYRTTWYDSTLYDWVKSTFLTSAFSTHERDNILYVSIPSKEEVEKYKLNTAGSYYWWTSTIGHHAYGETYRSEKAYIVTKNGYLMEESVKDSMGVRPVISISLNAFID